MTLSVQSYPKFRSVIPSTGEPNSGGWVYTYETGTTIKQNTYADAQGETKNDNPIHLDSNGEAFIWILNTDDAAYDFVIKDSSLETIQTILDIQQVAIVNNNTTFSGNLPIDNNSIIDSNNKKYQKYTSSADAANWITITNSATGVGPTTGVDGGDTNIDHNLTAKGSGYITIARAKLGGVKYPLADGTAGQILTTNGSNQLSFSSISNVASTTNVSYSLAVDSGAGLSIDGGTDGQSLHTHGDGNLYWADDSSGGTAPAFTLWFSDETGGNPVINASTNVSAVNYISPGQYSITLTTGIISATSAIVANCFTTASLLSPTSCVTQNTDGNLLYVYCTASGGYITSFLQCNIICFAELL